MSLHSAQKFLKETTVDQIQAEQRSTCAKFDLPFYKTAETDILGVSRELGSGKLPLNGLRHPPSGETSGWYLWAGEYSDADDFFTPIHAGHLLEICPHVVGYLGLPPGWRFLVDHNANYEDVWFDEQLLHVESE